MSNTLRHLATSHPAKQPAHSPEKGKNDPSTSHQPDNGKPGQKAAPDKPRQPAKAGSS